MARESVPIGIMVSTSGSYSAVGEAIRAGAILAIEEIAEKGGDGPAFDPVFVDPRPEPAAYAEAARRLLAGARVRHVVGCYTSSSRKEVIPIFEKHDALLWYPSHYEGFETNENVIYTGAAPNQHVVPLARYLLDAGRRRTFLVGSNYIWAWENNRILREAVLASGGAVLGERYVPVGDTDLAALAGQVLDARPDFVFSTLIGSSALSFHRIFRRAAALRGIDQADEVPIASCSLAEPELAALGEDAAGHLVSSVYFSTLVTPENARFVRVWKARFPRLGRTSADAETAYVAVHLLARALAAAGTDAHDRVRAAAGGLRFDAPEGPVTIDPENRHCHMRPRIGRSRAAGDFEILFESPTPVRPDPYLVWDGLAAGTTQPPQLRVVS